MKIKGADRSLQNVKITVEHVARAVEHLTLFAPDDPMLLPHQKILKLRKIIIDKIWFIHEPSLSALQCLFYYSRKRAEWIQGDMGRYGVRGSAFHPDKEKCPVADEYDLESR
ncbi:hypothetical protein ACH52_2669 [Eubacterium limosum]|nr:hypothetical protein ACH52_2669 [Eubacterium limosum]